MVLNSIHFKAFVYCEPSRVQTCGIDKRRIIHLEKQEICTTLDWYLKYENCMKIQGFLL